MPTTWQQNLVGVMSRMFLRWASATNESAPGWAGPTFTPATSIENFWEAEAMAPRFGLTQTDGDVKMVLGLFDELFGTDEGAMLRLWCHRRGWALVWALGQVDGGGNGPAPQWTNGVAIYALNQRLLDPTQTGSAGHNLSLPLAFGANAMAVAWDRLAPGSNRTMELVRTEWQMLWQALPPLQVEPLSGFACADLDCIGISASTCDCVCYEAS